METNAIVISHQTPQDAIPGGVPKVGEKLWFVVVDDGNTYRPTKLCIANSDKWSEPLDFAALLGGAGLTQTQANALYATIAQGNKADSALQASSSLDATKLTGLVPVGSIPTSVATDAEVTAAIAAAIAAIPSSAPEIVLATADPSTTPTAGQRLYVRTNTGAMWVAVAGAWSSITSPAEIVIATPAPTGAPGAGQSLYIRITDGAMWFAAGGVWNPVATQRQRATNTTVYTVATTGSDTTGDGLVTPFATIQKAINTIAALDGNGFTASVSITGTGSYAGCDVSANVVGWTSISIAAPTANTATITSPITVATTVPTTIRRLTFTPAAPATSLFSISVRSANVTIRECTFSGGDAAFNHVLSADSAIRQLASLTVSGTFSTYIKGNNTTIYHSGTVNAATAVTFTTFFDVLDGAIVQGVSAPVTPTGTFTGSKYNAAYVGVADALIPGSLSGVRSVQAFDPTLQSITDTTATGLIQRNANETVTLLPVGTTGAQSLAASTPLTGRTAIGFDDRAKAIVVASRGLVFNGSCTMPLELDSGGIERGPGFSTWTVDKSISLAGSYSYNIQAGWQYSDGLFSISPGVTYGLFCNTYLDGIASGQTYRMALFCFDGEPTPLANDRQYNSYLPNTKSRLSRPLNVGDRDIYIEQAGVDLASIGYAYTAFALYGANGYVSPSGIRYFPPHSNSPLGYYTRWAQYTALAVGASTTLIGSTEIKITLHSTAPAWDIANPAGGAWPIGTLTGVNNANDNNGIYAFSGVDRTLISNAWDSVRPGTGTDFKFGVFGTGTGATQLLPGTRLVRAGIFMPQSAPAKIQFDILPLPI